MGGWTEYKLERQFPNLVFLCLAHFRKHTPNHRLNNPGRESFTSGQNSAWILAQKTWPCSWTDHQLQTLCFPNVFCISKPSVITAQQHHQASNILYRLLLQVHVITAQRCHSESPTPRTRQPAWLARFNGVYEGAQTWFWPLSIFPFFHWDWFESLSPRARCTLGAHPHSRSCLYMWGYFQTQPAKNIQPAVNMGSEGGVSVFHFLCLFTGAFPASPQARERWMMDGDFLTKRALPLLTEIDSEDPTQENNVLLSRIVVNLFKMIRQAIAPVFSCATL